MDRGEALWASVIANILFIAALPFWGRLSDRIGRKPVLIMSAAGAALFHFPMTWLLKDSPWQLAVTMSVMLFFIAGSAAIVPAVYAELFPTKIRTVGVGVPYSICVAAFGGTAPVPAGLARYHRTGQPVQRLRGDPAGSSASRSSSPSLRRRART